MSKSSDIDLTDLQNSPSPECREWHFLPETDSTNAEIIRHLPSHPSGEGLVVIADCQTGGKGRSGRIWHSAPGTGIYLSMLIQPKLSPEQLPIVTLMAGLATAIAVNEFIPSPAQLKWPNDLLLNNKKIAGVLCEYHATKVPAVIIGIGINVNHTQFPTDIKDIATSIKLESGLEINRTTLIKQLVTQLDFQYSELKSNKVQSLIDNWTLHSDLFGKSISISKGGQSITGKAVRLDNLGRLVILNESGKEIVLDSGEVRIQRI
ncbi:MAG TPA: biotin--[acetyl-CoA-carboxylase] ligase [Nitrospinae bacterium]|nr:biotin--[acetyl-CoA-carboxylase] ligase [Nitrospinota bacterium]